MTERSTPAYAPPLLRELSSRVRANLAAQGLSQADLARRLDVSQKHVSRVLNGHDDGSIPFWDAMLRESAPPKFVRCSGEAP